MLSIKSDTEKKTLKKRERNTIAAPKENNFSFSRVGGKNGNISSAVQIITVLCYGLYIIFLIGAKRSGATVSPGCR